MGGVLWCVVSQLHGTSSVKEPRHSRSISSSTRNSILRPVPLRSAPIRTSRTTWHVIASGVSTVIHNLAKFKPHCTLPGTGPPSSPSESGFSGICPRSVTLVHMRFIRTGSPKSASQSKGRERCKTFFFPVCSFLTTYAGTPSATRVTTVCKSLPHQFFSFRHWPQKASSFTSTQSPGCNSTAPTFRSYSRFCHRASFRAESCANFMDFRRCLYSVSTYSSMVRVRLCSRRVGNNRSIGSWGLWPNIK